MNQLWTPPGAGKLALVTKDGTYLLDPPEPEPEEKEEPDEKRRAWTLPGGYL